MPYVCHNGDYISLVYDPELRLSKLVKYFNRPSKCLRSSQKKSISIT